VLSNVDDAGGITPVPDIVKSLVEVVEAVGIEHRAIHLV
jgi:hypothetical protein